MPDLDAVRQAYALFARKHPQKAARRLAKLQANEGAPGQDHRTAIVDGLTAGLDGSVRCRSCGKELTDPESVRLRKGPDCRARERKAGYGGMSPRKKAAPAAPETVLVLRTCDAEMRSHNGFQWPTEGEVAAPDWKPTKACGNGLHGLLWGEGDGGLLNWAEDARWLVVEVPADSIVDLVDKVKFPAGRVVFVGDRIEATKYLSEHGGAGRAIVGGTATAGDGGTATAGDGGTATAGVGGTATAGVGGTATAGVGGTATAGDGGTATAGDGGVLVILWWDRANQRYRNRLAEVGENGIEAGRLYRLNEAGLFVPAQDREPVEVSA